jgi:hypothetical protein
VLEFRRWPMYDNADVVIHGPPACLSPAPTALMPCRFPRPAGIFISRGTAAFGRVRRAVRWTITAASSPLSARVWAELG